MRRVVSSKWKPRWFVIVVVALLEMPSTSVMRKVTVPEGRSVRTAVILRQLKGYVTGDERKRAGKLDLPAQVRDKTISSVQRKGVEMAGVEPDEGEAARLAIVADPTRRKEQR